VAAQQRHQQQRHDVDDLDQRVDGRARGVLVRIADGVAGHRRLVGVGTLAAEVAFLDVLLGVVPGAAAGAHRDRDEQARDDRADQQAAERLDAFARAHQRVDAEGHDHRHQDRQQRGDDHLLDRRLGQQVDRACE
jgi:hypothetical protein